MIPAPTYKAVLEATALHACGREVVVVDGVGCSREAARAHAESLLREELHQLRVKFGPDVVWQAVCSEVKLDA